MRGAPRFRVKGRGERVAQRNAMKVSSLFTALACAALTTGAAQAKMGWPVFGHDPARSGVDRGDRLLTAQNVSNLTV
jgi:hypothetical protein